MPVSCERRHVDFLVKSTWRFCKFWILSGIMLNNERSWPLWASVHTFWNFQSKRWIFLPSGTLLLLKYFLHWRCQKKWFCGKVRFDDFYPLLRSIVSTWIHIGVKRISQACYLHLLKNMEKIVKRNFGMENKIGLFFWSPYFLNHCNLYNLLFHLGFCTSANICSSM